MSATAEPRWIVVDTPMRPRRYKVVQEGRHSPDGASSDNAVSNYFEHETQARHEAWRRNNVWPIITKTLVDVFRQDRGVYEDTLLRWLAARRDYPFDTTPEPECPKHLEKERVRIIAEFNRRHRPFA